MTKQVTVFEQVTVMIPTFMSISPDSWRNKNASLNETLHKRRHELFCNESKQIKTSFDVGIDQKHDINVLKRTIYD